MTETIDAPAVMTRRERVSPGAWWALAVLFLFYVLSYVDRTIISVLAESIKKDLALTDTEMSLVLGPAFMLFYAIFCIPFGWAADRYPRRWVIFFGTSLWSVAAAGTGFASSFIGMFLARTGVGIGESALAPSAYSLLADKFPRHRLAVALSIYQSGLYVGTAGAYAIAAYVLSHASVLKSLLPFMADWAPWHITLVITGAPGILLASLVFTFTEPARRGVQAQVAGEKAAVGSIWPYMRTNARLMLLLMVGFGLIAMSAYALQAWTPTYLQRRFGWTPVRFGPALSLIGLLSAATLLFKGVIMDWLYRRGLRDAHIRLYTWILAPSIPAVFFLFLASEPVYFLVMYALVQTFTIPFLVFLAPTIQLAAPASVRGRLTALFLLAFAILGAAGPVVVGLMTDYVFHDETKLGLALAIVICASIPVALVLLRMALPALRSAILTEERRADAVLQDVAR